MSTLKRLLRRIPAPTGGVLVMALIMTSCSDQPEPLPGGYFIFIASSSEMILNEPKYGGSILELGRDLQAVGHHNGFIFGRSGAARGATAGFFLLNTRDGSISAGLTESNWLGLTATSGIPQPPLLRNPAHQRPIRR